MHVTDFGLEKEFFLKLDNEFALLPKATFLPHEYRSLPSTISLDKVVCVLRDTILKD